MCPCLRPEPQTISPLCKAWRNPSASLYHCSVNLALLTRHTAKLGRLASHPHSLPFLKGAQQNTWSWLPWSGESRSQLRACLHTTGGSYRWWVAGTFLQMRSGNPLGDLFSLPRSPNFVFQQKQIWPSYLSTAQHLSLEPYVGVGKDERGRHAWRSRINIARTVHAVGFLFSKFLRAARGQTDVRKASSVLLDTP